MRITLKQQEILYTILNFWLPLENLATLGLVVCVAPQPMTLASTLGCATEGTACFFYLGLLRSFAFPARPW